jgi:hypothetical protein
MVTSKNFENPEDTFTTLRDSKQVPSIYSYIMWAKVLIQTLRSFSKFTEFITGLNTI